MKSTRMSWLWTLAIPVVMVVIAVLSVRSQPHSETALLTDWSSPPPLPVFVALNAVAGAFRSVADALTPPPIRIVDMVFGYHNVILLHIAQKLEIPDLLADGPLTAAAIAEKVGSDADVIERAMFALVGREVFKLGKPAADGAPRFTNSALSAVLRKDHPNSMRGTVGHNAEVAYPMWGKLPAFVADPKGGIAWDLASPEFPYTKGGIWSYFEKKPELEEQFGRAMSALDSLGVKAMVADGPWSKFQRIVDLGGSRGHVLHSILEAAPGQTGVLLDRAPVIENAKAAWAPDGPYHSAASRIEMVTGSFFDASSIPKARDGDAYVMRYILHDWQEADVLRILQNVRSAAGDARATLIIGESAVPDHDTVAVPPVVYNIDMQMMGFFNGRERTKSEWRKTLAEAGFELVRFHSTRSLLHWIEARPV